MICPGAHTVTNPAHENFKNTSHADIMLAPALEAREEMKRALIITIALWIVTSGNPIPACTTFCYVDDGQVIFGKNYDWNVDDGHIIVNKRGAFHAARDSAAPDNRAHWQSRYGSVTFNQYGRDNPSGGM